MKLRQQKAAPDTTDEAVAPTAEPKAGLLRECWSDLRGRPRPVEERAWEDETPRIETGGVGLDADGMRRLHARYGSSTN